MIRRPPRSTRTDTLFPYTTLFRSRLFSYLDTQKSRLGTTNFHQIPINAPKCPFHNFQRNGMMQTLVPTGRANYEPNSLAEAGDDAGPRACPETGSSTLPANDERNNGSQKLRTSAALFADQDRKSTRPHPSTKCAS